MPTEVAARPAGAVKILGLSALPLALLLATAPPAAAWSPETTVDIGLQGATIAPPDLKRQIERHERAYTQGLLEPMTNPTATGEPLDEVIEAEVARAVRMIRTHQPMAEVVRQMGVVAHYVAHANNPLLIGRSDSNEGDYYADYLAYVDSARPRFAVVFYGLVPEFESSGVIPDLVRRTFRRGQILYPLVGREYDRIGSYNGRALFDDRSTAFGVSAVAFSQAVTDVAILLRHTWIEGGGHDPRRGLLMRKGEFEVPRTSAIPLEQVQGSGNRFSQ
jgi:hypothetical protein